MKKPEIIKFCAFCNDQFIASRPTATFCSNTCRTKACVKRKQDERAKADQEALRKQEQEQLRQIADAKRLKREEKAESKRQEQVKIDENAKLVEEEKKIQDEIDTFETTTKNQLINSIVGLIHLNAETKEGQLLADKERKKNDNRIRSENEMEKAQERVKIIEKGIAELIKNLSNQNNSKSKGNASTQPGLIITPTVPPEPEMPSQLRHTTPTPPTIKPVRKSIVEDILDQLDIF